MKISHESGGKEYLLCLCGNTVRAEGFYPCDAQGKVVEPTLEKWTTNLVVCDRCGRIINQTTLEVVGSKT